MNNKQNRKLSAILFADIQGYTAMMQDDEAAARACLDKFHFTLTTHVEDHNGQIINNYGDGCLCTFDSAVAAANCAKEIQLVFQTIPKVPVRIGLHSGEVFFENDNVFGDAVNIASRIESMGVAGSVLLSNTIQDQIHNQSTFDVSPLGKFEFKNVNKPITVYALKAEGLVVPDKDQLGGKLKKEKEQSISKPANRRWLWPMVLFGLVTITFAWWKFGGNTGGAEALQETLIEEIKAKRVVVIPFENQTMNASLDVFGNMTSDWLTKGLMEMENVDVISSSGFQSIFGEADINNKEKVELSQQEGVDVLLRGRYYLNEDQIIIHANLEEAATGKIIKNLGDISGPKDNLMPLIEELSEQVLGFWAVQGKKRFLKKPPKYQAYKLFLEGVEQFNNSDFKKSEDLLIKAFEQDTTFYIAALKLMVVYQINFDFEKKKELGIELEKYKNQFTKWESLRFKDLNEHNALKRAELNSQLYQLDKSAIAPFNNVLVGYGHSIRPELGLEFIENLDEPLVQFNSTFQRIVQVDKAYLLALTGAYEEAAVMFSNSPENKRNFKYYRNALTHLKVLAKLNNKEELKSNYEKYTEVFLKNDGSAPIGGISILLKAICEELIESESKEQLKEYLTELERHTNTNTTGAEKNNNTGFIHWYKGDYKSALENWSKDEFESIFDFPLYQETFKALCYIELGQLSNAQNQFKKIKQWEALKSSPRFEAAKFYCLGLIMHRMAENEKALAYFKDAKALGIPVGIVERIDWYYNFSTFEYDSNLSKSFRESPAFKAMME